MSQQNCTNCGVSNALNTKFCTECGARLTTLPAKTSLPQHLTVSLPTESASSPLVGTAGLIKNSNIIQNIYHQPVQRDPKEIYGEAVYGALQNKGVIDAAARTILDSLRAALSLTEFQAGHIEESAKTIYSNRAKERAVQSPPPPLPAPPPPPLLLPTVARYHYTGPTGQKEGTENEILSWIMAAPTSEHHIWQAGWPDWKSWRGVEAFKIKIEKLLPPPAAKSVIISLPSPAPPPPTPQKAPTEFVLIQPGHFMIGSPASEKRHNSDENQHEIEITSEFWMQTTPVTQYEWQTLMGNNPSHFKGDLHHPVEMVSWFDAVTYCNALSQKEGLIEAYILTNIQGRPGEKDYTCDVNWKDFGCNGYRLPTEAEWEYAARAGTTTAFYNGDCRNPKGKDKNLDQIAWYDKNSDDTIHPVKAKKPNPWNLYDMLGNVGEWCWDWYSSMLPHDHLDNFSRLSERVVRGGSWTDYARDARVACRSYYNPNSRFTIVGFRPAKSNHLSSVNACYQYIGPTDQKEGTENEIVSWIMAALTSEHHIWQAGWSNWKSWKSVDSFKTKIEKSLRLSAKLAVINLSTPASEKTTKESLAILRARLLEVLKSRAELLNEKQSSFSRDLIKINLPIPTLPLKISEGFVLIQPGHFMMGSLATDKNHYEDETKHPVEITRPLYLKITPVTQGEWQSLMGNNPSHFKGDFDRPVEMVSWFDAVAYCNALSQKEGLNEAYTLTNIRGRPGEKGYTSDVSWRGFDSGGYRLPTEAEWEYAARAGTITSFYNGECLVPEGKDANLDQIAWYNQNSGRTTHPVKAKKPNPWGLYDILGNIFEWCWDWGTFYLNSPQRDPSGSSSGSRRILRGGSWNFGARRAIIARRNGANPDNRRNDIGFRPVRSISYVIDPFLRQH